MVCWTGVLMVGWSVCHNVLSAISSLMGGKFHLFHAPFGEQILFDNHFYRDPERTSFVIDACGWLHTGYHKKTSLQFV